MTKRTLLEKKEWEYYIYEAEATIELSVPISNPAPGFDIIYVLNDFEKNEYLSKGVKALKDRLNDMETNFLNYKMISWR
ncbi:hypothetical protein ABGT15_06600 [Flavobacterium enshiense]|uniref:hypothetical protein n=1 Tax=Flavobacterium enshiense TaxID=1341165 RepID=UPI00345DE6AE